MNRFNRDYALVRSDGQIIAESHNADRLDALRYELVSEGVIASVVASDLPRSTADDWRPTIRDMAKHLTTSKA